MVVKKRKGFGAFSKTKLGLGTGIPVVCLVWKIGDVAVFGSARFKFGENVMLSPATCPRVLATEPHVHLSAMIGSSVLYNGHICSCVSYACDYRLGRCSQLNHGSRLIITLIHCDVCGFSFPLV